MKLFRDKGATSLVFDDKTLIVVDYAANIRKIMTLVKELDQPSESDSAKLYFVKLTHVLAADARKILEDIFMIFQKRDKKKCRLGQFTQPRRCCKSAASSGSSRNPQISIRKKTVFQVKICIFILLQTKKSAVYFYVPRQHITDPSDSSEY